MLKSASIAGSFSYLDLFSLIRRYVLLAKYAYFEGVDNVDNKILERSSVTM